MSGEISRADIEKNRRDRAREKSTRLNREREDRDRADVVDENIRSEMKRLLFIGLSTIQIQDILDITNETFNKLLDEFEKKREITKGQIKTAREQRLIENKDIVYEMYLDGYSWKDIVEKIQYSNKIYIESIMQKLRDEGRVNDEIDKKAREAKHRRQEEAKKCEQEKDDIEEEREPFEEKILEYFRLGFLSKEIQKMTNLSGHYISRIKKKLIANGEITDKDIKKNVASREPKAKRRRKALIAMTDNERKINTETVNEHISYVKAKMELGEMEPRDMELISVVVSMERELMTFGNINFIIKYFTESDKLQYAVNFINCCLRGEHDYERTKKLTAIRETVQIKIEREKMSRRDKWLNDSGIKVSAPEPQKRKRGRPPKNRYKLMER